MEIDINELIQLCEEHAIFEGQTYEKENKRTLLIDLLFQPHKTLNALVVQQNNRLVGYATFIKQVSTWDAGYYLYLDCLYLIEEIRGKGIGHQLMKRIMAFAKHENCKRVEWQTPSSNLLAIEFYKNLKAIGKNKKRFFWPVQ